MDLLLVSFIEQLIVNQYLKAREPQHEEKNKWGMRPFDTDDGPACTSYEVIRDKTE